MCQQEPWGATAVPMEAHSTQKVQPPRMHVSASCMYGCSRIFCRAIVRISVSCFCKNKCRECYECCVLVFQDVQGQWQAMQQQQQPTVWNPVVASDQYQYQQQWDPSGQAQMWSQQPTQFYQVQPTENVAPSIAADAAYHQG